MDDEEDYMEDGVFVMPEGGFSFGDTSEPEEIFGPEGPIVEKIDMDGSELYVLSVPLEPDFPPSLSPSERDVVKLALTGASNAEIAETRESAVQTVANQLRSAFQKLGVNSRAELAAVLFGSNDPS